MCYNCCQISHFLIPRDVRLAIFCPRGRVLTAHHGRVLVDIPWQQGEFVYLLFLLEQVRTEESLFPKAQELWISKLRQLAHEQARWREFYRKRKHSTNTLKQSQKATGSKNEEKSKCKPKSKRRARNSPKSFKEKGHDKKPSGKN